MAQSVSGAEEPDDNAGVDPATSRRKSNDMHNFRIPLPLWIEMGRCVKLRDDKSISAVIIRCIKRYIDDTHRRQERGTLPPFPDE